MPNKKFERVILHCSDSTWGTGLRMFQAVRHCAARGVVELRNGAKIHAVGNMMQNFFFGHFRMRKFPLKGIPSFLVPAFSLHAIMNSFIKDFKIRGLVVLTVAVFMMNAFGWQKTPTDFLFSNVTVFIHPNTVNLNSEITNFHKVSVSTMFAPASRPSGFIFVCALIGAIFCFFCSASGNNKITATLFADQSDRAITWGSRSFYKTPSCISFNTTHVS